MLLAEDNIINQQVVRITVERMGASVDVAAHGGEAIELFKRFDYDLVLMDIRMPEVDGVAATRAIRELGGGMPIFALTADAMKGDRERFISAGMNGYLSKPLSEPDLVQVLMDARGGELLGGAGAAAAAAEKPAVEASPADEFYLQAAGAVTLDRDGFYALIGHDEDLVQSLLSEFIYYAKQYAQEGRDALEQGDVGTASARFHKLAGSAATVCAMKLRLYYLSFERYLMEDPPQAALCLQRLSEGKLRCTSCVSKSNPERRASMANNRKQRRVLVADDDPITLQVIRHGFESQGIYADYFDNGDALLEHLNEAVEACILDIQMPGRDGMECLQHIKQAHPSVEVVILTNLNQADEAKEALKNGAFDYITKPFDLKELTNRITNAMRLSRSNREREEIKRSVAEPVRATPGLGESEVMQTVKEMVSRIAPTESAVLVTGESGTGKTLLARAIHSASLRADGPFVSVSCPSLPADLLESEMFGHEKEPLPVRTPSVWGVSRWPRGAPCFWMKSVNCRPCCNPSC